MEPSDLKSSSPDDAQLESWLRTNASLPALPDDGFSGRVLAALPPPARHRAPGRAIACVIGAVLGAAVAFVQYRQGGSLPDVDAPVLASLEQLSRPEISLAVGVTACALLYVFRENLRRLVPL
jgi:hypothetical protein